MREPRPQVISQLVKTGKWSDEQARLGERAGWRCEYCDRDMLGDIFNYKLWQRDHIIPKCTGGGEDFDNLAVSCRNCNWDFKRDWDPRTAIDPSSIPGRDDLIRAARAYITGKREGAEEELRLMRRIIGCNVPSDQPLQGQPA